MSAVSVLLSMKISSSVALLAGFSNASQTKVPGLAVEKSPGSNVTLFVFVKVARSLTLVQPSAMQGRSCTASALAPDELYDTVLPPLLPVVRSSTVIFQVPVLVSSTVVMILLPGLMVSPGMTTSLAGRISVHASYFAVPPMLSASVPAWTRVESLEPPIPTQSDEY